MVTQELPPPEVPKPLSNLIVYSQVVSSVPRAWAQIQIKGNDFYRLLYSGSQVTTVQHSDQEILPLINLLEVEANGLNVPYFGYFKVIFTFSPEFLGLLINVDNLALVVEDNKTSRCFYCLAQIPLILLTENTLRSNLWLSNLLHLGVKLSIRSCSTDMLRTHLGPHV